LLKVVTISIISHNQNDMVNCLLSDLESFPEVGEIILTHNKPEQEIIIPSKLQSIVKIIHNTSEKGFGANHNSAFKYCSTPYFCILNPDIRIDNNPFSELLSALENDITFVVAPLVLNSQGGVEDSFRMFPTPWRLLKRKLNKSNLNQNTINTNYQWLAGMFLLFNADKYKQLKGLDEEFYMYCEDVDICMRINKSGGLVKLISSATVVHNAQRMSRKNIQHILWHIQSMIRLWRKYLN
jgi:N-acetylglucosaminyl-diphospho-decaprenol L-rhamnosyltransferase